MANKNISDLTAAGALTGAELFEVERAGVNLQGLLSNLVTLANATAQPLDSDLTAIAALTTTTIGRSLLAGVDAAALRTILALGTAATSASSAFDASGAAAAAQSASQPLDSDLTAIAALTTTTYGRSLLTAANAAAALTLLGAAPATPPIPSARTVSGNDTLVDGDVNNWVEVTANATLTVGTITVPGPFLIRNNGSGVTVTIAAGANTLLADTAAPLNKLTTQGRTLSVLPRTDLTHFVVMGAES